MAPARPARRGRPRRATDGPGVLVLEGSHDAEGLRFAIVSSRYNGRYADAILHGAITALMSRGASSREITVARVSGSWEIPVVARKMARSGTFDAVIGLGVLIEGETAHFDLIGREVARGLAEAAATTGVPVLFGVVTARNERQAAARAGGKLGNRGEESALAAIEAARVMRQMKMMGKTRVKPK